MAKYVLKRLLVLIPILLGVALIIFTIMDMTPGDPAVRILGPESSIEAREQLRQELGLNQPFWVRFFDYIKNIFLHLDFGNSYRTGKPVFDDIFKRLPVSVKVAFLGMLLATLMGLPLGVFSAVKQYSGADSFLRVASTVLVAMPTFWLAMLLILVFALYLGWLPAGEASSWKSYILPTITVGVPYGSNSLFLAIFLILRCVLPIFARFQCFLPYSRYYHISFSFFTFFSVSQHIPDLIVFLSHFPHL